MEKYSTGHYFVFHVCVCERESITFCFHDLWGFHVYFEMWCDGWKPLRVGRCSGVWDRAYMWQHVRYCLRDLYSSLVLYCQHWLRALVHGTRGPSTLKLLVHMFTSSCIVSHIISAIADTLWRGKAGPASDGVGLVSTLKKRSNKPIRHPSGKRDERARKVGV